MEDFSIAGESAEWNVFPRGAKNGRPVIVRSRTSQPKLRHFAAKNFMARIRCVLPSDQVSKHGMPLSTEELDRFEDQLLDGLQRMGARTYALAVVTADGCRDLYFAAAEGGELLAAIRQIRNERSFQLQPSRLDGPKDGLLESLTPPQN
jgi:hypothetical protein